MFSFKDRTPDALKSMVVYQFTCAGCNSCYIGETSRHFSTRIKEHAVSDKNSHIFKHLSQFPSCKGMYTPSCFRILDSANSSIDLKLKEAFYKNYILTYQCHLSSRFRILWRLCRLVAFLLCIFSTACIVMTCTVHAPQRIVWTSFDL